MPLKKHAKWLVVIAFVLIRIVVAGQSGSFGVYATVTEYMGDLNNNSTKFFQFKHNKVGGGIALQQYLSPSFNLSERIAADGLQYQTDDQKKGVDASLFSLNAFLKFKLNNNNILKEEALVAPFLAVGFGGVQIDSKQLIVKPVPKSAFIASSFQVNWAFGVGCTFQLSSKVHLELSSLLYMPINDSWDGLDANRNNDKYLQHSIGLIFPFNKKDSDKDGVSDKKDKCPGTPHGTKVDKTGCPVEDPNADSDGDGVVDGKDKCPNTPSGERVNFYGCPVIKTDNASDDADTDGDGVPNYRDRCKHTPPGVKVDYFGCPIDDPDSDGDGISDDKDKCPGTPRGVKVGANGCPQEADNDKDGVPNSKDKCPNTPGDNDNRGCPTIKEEVKKRLSYATQNINFETGKYIITKSSYSVLNDVIKILGEYPDYSLKMGGHTDDVGSDNSNLVLSQRRVNAVKAYFVSKGVAANRIDATGYGESKPIAPNTTAAGKAKNRRVDLELFLR